MIVEATIPVDTRAPTEQVTAGRTGAINVWWLRVSVLALILIAFAHTAVLLDAKDLWWDESLSLQRAEESLPNLLRGILVIKDGMSDLPTIDQHPFFSFLLQGLLIRTAGNSVFVLRFVSALAAVLFTASVYAWARWLARRELAPVSTALWATALAAVNPFMLWYGQEARPYALWSALALLTTYLLLRATEEQRLHRGYLVAFAAFDVMFILTHYYAVFLVTLHLIILALWSIRWRVNTGMAAAAIVVAVGSIVGGNALWSALDQGAGANFPSITLRVLIPDLVNSFSLGPSADLALAWPADLIVAVLALIGAGWGVRSRTALRLGGWVLPAAILLPVLFVLVLNAVQPLYMNSRHLSLLVGPFVLLVGAGLAGVGCWRRWAPWPLAAILFAATGWSTVNYYTLEAYAKDDYTTVGEYMQGRIMPGDAVLYYPPSSWRIFDYYLPMGPVYAAIERRAPLGVYGLPLLNRSFDETYEWLATLGDRFDRVWVIKSRTHPYFDLESDMEKWLVANFLRVRDAEFFSHSALRVQLYLPKIPVFDELPPTVQHSVIAEFGSLIQLAGYDAAAPIADDLPSQIRLYWQVLSKPERRYRYIWSLIEQDPFGRRRTLSMVEREPYEGDIPTLYWDPGKTIMEFVEFPPQAPATFEGSTYFYALQVYDAETLEKLPVTQIENGEIDGDGVTAMFPAEAP